LITKEFWKDFLSSILPFIDYGTNVRGEITVENETANLYRYWDTTAFADFLYDCLAETVNRDLAEELRLLQVFDLAMQAVKEIVDMLDCKASLILVILILAIFILSLAGVILRLIRRMIL
jgi:hypothetical protein